MSFPRYPKYKDSGVEWLPPVPAHWNVSRLRHCVESIYSGGTPESSEARFWTDGEEGIPWVAIGDMTREPIVARTDRYVSEVGLLSKGLRVLPSGTLLYSMYASIGKVAVLGIAATINQAILGIVPAADTLSGDYLRYWLIQLEGHLALFSSSNTQDNLNAAKVRSFPVFSPPPADQSLIVRFLDRETAKIDSLIWEQQRLMELLQEKRRAVISHAVTKGLNPDAPMKPSGVEWLGEVPAHWSVLPLGYLCERLTYGFTNPMPTADDGPFMLTANDIDYGRIRYEGARRTRQEAFDGDITDKSRPQMGDILITKDGTLGRVAVHDGQPACINQSVALLRIRYGAADTRFIGASLLASAYQDRMLYDAGGTTIKHIYVSRLAKMPIALPPLDEQLDITRTLLQQRKRLDELERESQVAVNLLTERRSALISAAVTGQIDLRGIGVSEAA